MPRHTFTEYQIFVLKKAYAESEYLTNERKTEIAQLLNLAERRVHVWFQNRRRTLKKQAQEAGVENKSRGGQFDPLLQDESESYTTNQGRISVTPYQHNYNLM